MKPETCVIIGVLVYLATIALNRFLGERNYASLTPDEKLKLTDAFSSHRSLGTYIPIAIMLLVIVIGYSYPHEFPMLFAGGVVAVLMISLALQIAIVRDLKKLSLPDAYVNKFRVQSMLVQFGNIAALSMLAYGIVAR
jgi:hypothetical protein